MGRYGFLMREKRLKEKRLKMARNGHSASMKSLLLPAAMSVADIPSFPAFHLFLFQLTNSQRITQLRTIFIIFYFPPTVAFCGWNTYPIYHGRNREKCPCLSDNFWCKEMEESPVFCFPGPRADASPFKKEGSAKATIEQ